MKPTRLIFLLGALAGIAFLSYQRFHRPQNTPSAPAGENDLVIRSIPVYHSLALGKFDIPAKASHEVKITMDPSLMRNARLIGHFSTLNGVGIQVMLLDESQFGNFRQNQTPSGILYISKTTTNGDIETTLPKGGTYYLVFDNSASDKPANVDANVTLRYETVHVDSGSDLNKK
jgi:hypothetical protein